MKKAAFRVLPPSATPEASQITLILGLGTRVDHFDQKALPHNDLEP